MNSEIWNQDQLPFEPDPQCAVIGHCIRDAQLFNQFKAAGVEDRFFLQPADQKTWRAIDQFAREQKRHPTLEEVCALTDVGQDSGARQHFRERIQQAMNLTIKYGADALLPKVIDWQKATVIHGYGQAFVKQYNKRHLSDSVGSALLMADKLRALDLIQGEGLMASAARVVNERSLRLQDQHKVVPYGVSFLDDATGGMIPNELVLVGAKAGVGKTGLVTRIAASNAKERRVAFFALEAEQYEIERRLKFSMLQRLYLQDNPGMSWRAVTYPAWRMGRLEDKLSKYEEITNVAVTKLMPQLKTYYRSSGGFSIETLDRTLSQAARESDLIIFDHIHYVDTNPESNENSEYKRALKVIRDIALSHGVPVILVAHLRKTMEQRKNAPLLPSLEDFHGTSDLGKISTTAVIIGPAEATPTLSGGPLDESLGRSWPTYMHVVKNRMEGSRTRFAGISYYDPAVNLYLPEYSVGRFVKNGTDWVACTDAELQGAASWATRATVTTTLRR